MNVAIHQCVLTLALDLANKTGWAIGDGTRIDVGVWDLTFGAVRHCGGRLVRLRNLLIETIRTCEVRRLAMEASSFGSNNQATAAAHNELRGIARLVACEMGLPIVEHKPKTIKAFAGYGGASKLQMIRAAKTLLGVDARDDNEADAAFVLALDLDQQQRPWAWAAKAAARKPKRSRKRKPTERRFF